MLNTLIRKFKNNKEQLLFCTIITFIIGLCAYAYQFLNNSFSHDSLCEFVSGWGASGVKISVGRFVVPIYRFLTRGITTLPWLIGLLALLYISIVVFLITKIFDIKSKLAQVLVACIFTTNLSVIATIGTYIHDLDCNMLGLALSVLAVFLWKKHRYGFIPGVLLICTSLGIYQSYIATSLVLIILVLVMDLLNGIDAISVLIKGIRAGAMLLIGGFCYLILSKSFCQIVLGVPLASGTYNSLDTITTFSCSEILKLIASAYKDAFLQILNVSSGLAGKASFYLHVLLLLIIATTLIGSFFSKRILVKEKLLIFLLCLVLPLSMNIIYVFSGGLSDDLSHSALWLIYLMALLLTSKSPDRIGAFQVAKYGKLLVIVCITVIMFGNIVMSNAISTKKHIEADATKSYMTRVLYTLEQQENYVINETPVIFIGQPSHMLKTVDGFEQYMQVRGNSTTYALGAALSGYYSAYFENVLLYPITLADNADWELFAEKTEVKEMPDYPAEGCMRLIDDIFVVKLGPVQGTN